MNNVEAFLNRELSWLQFNYRVLKEAKNPQNPLLEKMRFLAISDKNLDEFYMIRVAGLKRLKRLKSSSLPQDNSSIEALEEIEAETIKMLAKQQSILEELIKDLEEADIEIITSEKNLNEKEIKWLEENFDDKIFSILTPLAVDPMHPFPLIANDAFAFVLKLKKNRDSKLIYSLLVIPQNFPRFIYLKNSSKKIVPLEICIKLFFKKIFQGFTILDQGLFHIIRDSDIQITDDVEDDVDLINSFRAALKDRQQGHVIRLIVQDSLSDDLENFLLEQLEACREDIFRIKADFLNLSDFDQLTQISRSDLLFKPYLPRFPERIVDYNYDYFAAIKAKDILVHHPYESFDVVVDFLNTAANDPNVIAIKQTLYRTSSDSLIVKALIHAAEKGKAVTAVVELKARFNEEVNINLSATLEQAGVQVVYGFIDYKIHSKMSLVIRKEKTELKHYVHIGTGNYHPLTAQIYTDVSLFTCDKAITKDIVKIFNFLTGYAEPEDLEKIIISPFYLQNSIIDLIDNEIKNAKAGKVAEIWAKMNSLVDSTVIKKLYEASNAGVKINLIVRGICCLKPGLKGLSENISVKSIIGRFLEHSRIACFANGQKIPSANTKVFISSADWMARNFHNRVEMMAPIENPTVQKQLLEQIMLANLKDDSQSWIMNSDGTYSKTKSNDFSSQKYFMTNKSLSGTSIKQKQKQKKKRKIKLIKNARKK